MTDAHTTKGARLCRVAGCQNRVHGNGLCNKHALRWRNHGTTDANPKYGERAAPVPLIAHDMYLIWQTFRSKSKPRPVIAEWRDSFEVFLAQVTPRPTETARLSTISKAAPLGPDNYEWREKATTSKRPEETRKEYLRRQQTERRLQNPAQFKRYHLQRNFGIEVEEYDRLFVLQGGKCRICRRPETATYKGVVTDLCVDHCHETDAIRGLLCRRCNQGLGQLEDNLMLMARGMAHIAEFKTDKMPMVEALKFLADDGAVNGLTTPT